MEVEIRFKSHPTFRKPYLICGLPGIAYVGKLSVDHLIKELNAKLFAKIYSKYFPPYVLIQKNGIVELMKNELYFRKNEAGRDLIFFTGNTQAASPEGQYVIAEEVLNTAITLGVKRLYATAAFIVDKPIGKPKVYGAATDLKLMEEVKQFGVLPMQDGKWSPPVQQNGRKPTGVGKVRIEGVGEFSFDAGQVKTLRSDIFQPGHFFLRLSPGSRVRRQ